MSGEKGDRDWSGCPPDAIPEKVRKILLHVRKEVKGPLTIKIRQDGIRRASTPSRSLRLLRIAASTGHPSSQNEGPGVLRSGGLGLIAALKKAITVRLSGTEMSLLRSREKMLEETGCDG